MEYKYNSNKLLNNPVCAHVQRTHQRVHCLHLWGPHTSFDLSDGKHKLSITEPGNRCLGVVSLCQQSSALANTWGVPKAPPTLILTQLTSKNRFCYKENQWTLWAWFTKNTKFVLVFRHASLYLKRSIACFINVPIKCLCPSCLWRNLDTNMYDTWSSMSICWVFFLLRFLYVLF